MPAPLTPSNPPNAPTAAASHPARRAAKHVVSTLRHAGFAAYFAGGCVRDELLGLSPDDYDVATAATPRDVRALFPKAQSVGAAFGVMLVPVREHDQDPALSPEARASAVEHIEVATFRADGPYLDSRRPSSVTFADARADALRRDFTINALFLDPLGRALPNTPQALDGELLDWVGGQADLAAKVIRAVGDPDARLAEDHLRALRAVRFAARLDFTIEPATAAAISRQASMLRGVSPERVGEELRRMLAAAPPAPARAIALLEALGLDGPVLGEAGEIGAGEGRQPGLSVAATPVAAAPVAARPDGTTRATEVERLMLAPPPEGLPTMLVLAAWLLGRLREMPREPALWFSDHGVTDVVARVRRSMCLSNDESTDLGELLRCGRAFELDWASGTVAWRKRLSNRRLGLVSTRLVRPQQQRQIEQDIERLATDGIGLGPAPVVTGDHLISRGYKAGPGFKGLLDAVYDAQLEGRVIGLQDGLEFAARLRGGRGE